jgi:type IV fimbrial biogenesis protein FimT
MKGEKGFTLMELILVVAIMGILTTIAIPTFQEIMAQRRLNGAARLVMTDLLNARMQAVTQNHRFLVSVLDNRSYQVLDDNNENGVFDGGESRLIRNIADHFHDVLISANNSPLFLPRGTVTNMGTFTLTNAAGTRKVVVAATGRVRIE